MKTLSVLILSLVFAGLAHAKATTYVIPVLIESGDGYVSPEKLQEKYPKASALKNLPSVITLTDVKTASDQYDKQVTDIIATLDKAKAQQKKITPKDKTIDYWDVWSETFPNDDTDDATLSCYTGDAGQVEEMVRALVSDAYTEQMTIHAWRYGKTIKYAEDFDISDADNKSYLTESDAWTNYDKSSTDLLIISSIGDDGTDSTESLIPVCQ